MERLNYEEFYDEVWDIVSEKVVPNSFIEVNSDLVKAITFELWNLYDKDDKLSLKIMAKVSEIIFYNYITYGLKKDCLDENKGWRNMIY